MSDRSLSKPARPGDTGKASTTGTPSAVTCLLEGAARATSEGNLDEALRQLGEVLDLDRTNLLALGMRAGIHAQIGMTERATEEYEQLLRWHPDNALAQAQLAALWIQSKQAGRALTLLEQVRAKKPEDAHFMYLRGWALLALGRTKQALTELESASKKLPAADPAYPALATCEKARNMS